MKSLYGKELKEAQEKNEHSFLLKNWVMTEDENEIRLWDTTDAPLIETPSGLAWLADENERGFFLEVCMNGCCQLINMTDKNLVEVCQAFNTIIQTIKA